MDEIQALLLSCSQVMEAVHGVTIEEVQIALQRNDWNPVRAEQQLKVREITISTERKKKNCLFILQWIV